MKFQYIVSRFNQMKQDYIGNTSCFYTIVLWIDYAFAFLIHGASISDYFAYGFYKLRFSGRLEYITYRRFRWILNKCNKKEDIPLCRDKVKFNQTFSDLLGREWLDLSESTYEDYLKFIEKHEIFFLKDIAGFRGMGTQRIDVKKIDSKSFYDNLKSDNTLYILEEELQEIDVLKSLHPWSVNTMRINTLYDTMYNDVKIMSANLRIGNNQNHVDNLHYNGIASNINLVTGILETPGYDAHNKMYISHPITHKQIIGLQIPHWGKCIYSIKQAAKRLPTIRYIGWDVVIKPDGVICLIEANDNADHDLQQLHNKGLWKEYKNKIKHF